MRECALQFPALIRTRLIDLIVFRGENVDELRVFTGSRRGIWDDPPRSRVPRRASGARKFHGSNRVKGFGKKPERAGH